MKKENLSAGHITLGCLWVLMIFPIAIFLNAYTLMNIWNWFISPLGLTTINLVHAMGISTVIGFFLINIKTNDSPVKTNETIIELITRCTAKIIFVPLFILLYGYILSKFM